MSSLVCDRVGVVLSFRNAEAGLSSGVNNHCHLDFGCRFFNIGMSISPPGNALHRTAALVATLDFVDVVAVAVAFAAIVVAAAATSTVVRSWCNAFVVVVVVVVDVWSLVTGVPAVVEVVVVVVSALVVSTAVSGGGVCSSLEALLVAVAVASAVVVVAIAALFTITGRPSGASSQDHLPFTGFPSASTYLDRMADFMATVPLEEDSFLILFSGLDLNAAYDSCEYFCSSLYCRFISSWS